ncbi:MAG TPA: hypothetical protein VI039_12885 [Solirubrobacterales bacterium]
MSDRPRLHLISLDKRLDLLVNMGDGPATPTAGFAGHETVDRVRRKSLTSFVGVEPFAQDVPVLLDGYRENRSIQRQLDKLLEFGGQTRFRAFGPIHNEGLVYIFGDEPDFDSTPSTGVIRAEDGTLLKQRLVLKLQEYVAPGLAGKRREGKMGIGDAVPVEYVTRKGTATEPETLANIAHRLYHDWTRWKEIGHKNGINDPHRVLPPGRHLKL